QGIKVQANQGAVTVQAQNDELQLNALKDATLTSSAGKITIAAKEEILITCKGAYIKLSNGEVEIGSPKVVRVRAPLVVGGANAYSYPMKPFTRAYNVQFKMQDESGNIYARKKYLAFREDGSTTTGITDENGFTEVFFSDKSENVSIHLLEDSYEH
ncbi:DUF2345 domain-containing protein, partial [Neisseria sp. P0008.S010]|uniref:DUF2345 domain-containing protein n=1 Tax=Neisseria sp. P0008.S010 TaxID=3436707 RepID=UPI003F7D84F8